MCGICGFVNRDGRPACSSILSDMSERLIHRGPDDSGQLVDGSVAIAHRRLSIVDLARGQQPMKRRDAAPWIVYNGEIYNHLALRDNLPIDVWHTSCDTETILGSYLIHGENCVDFLRGMFAFAIHDPSDNSIFLARDRLGIKPLYVYESAGLFAFASEIKSLLAHPDITAHVNVSKLPIQLALKYTLDDETLFEGITKLAPGHWMRICAQETKKQQYWNLRYVPKCHEMTFDEAASEFRDRFFDSVRACLMADVPLGVLLSGGIDSSVIAAAMGDMVSEPIKSFSVAFAEREYSELEYSRVVARQVGTDSREIVISPEQWFAAWPQMVYHEDEPIAHPSSIPLHFVSALAAQEVKVVLTGEGADELMGGYERYYQTLTNLRYGKYVPGPLRSLARIALSLVPNTWTAKRKAVRTSLYLPCDIKSLYLDNYSALPSWSIRDALRPQFHNEHLDTMYDYFDVLMESSDAEELLDQILYADMKTYLLELLMKQDQMSMSASLESRVPFLDHHLVEFVCSLPTEFKVRGFQTKRILRHALGNTIPPSVVIRSKKGFPTPTREWFRNDFYPLIERLLLSDDSLSIDYIDADFTRQVLTRHRQGKWDLQEQIWALGNLEIWLRIFLENQSPETIFGTADEVRACVSCG